MFRFAILGAGKIASKFVDAARLACCEVASVASKDIGRARAFAEKNGIPSAYGSYDELLAHEKPDCAYIATVPSSHYEIAMKCLRSGVPVLCEKAMFRNSCEAKSAFALAREKGLFIMEALWSKFLPANVTAKRWLDAGRIGRPVFLDATIGFSAPKDAENRYFNPDLGGGAALDLTVYAYEIASFLLGAPFVTESVQVTRANTGVDGSELIALRAGDCLCSLRTSFMARLDEGLTIIGESGRIVIPHPHYASEAFLYGEDGELAEHFTDESTKNGFLYEIRETVACIREGRVESNTQTHADTIACAELFDRIHST